MAEPEFPDCIAFLPAEKVIGRPSVSDRRDLIGIFHTVVAPRFPVMIGDTHLYFVLTNAIGTYKLTINILTPEFKEETLYQRDIEFTDRLEVTDKIVRIKRLPLQKPGWHHISLIAEQGGQEKQISFCKILAKEKDAS